MDDEQSSQINIYLKEVLIVLGAGLAILLSVNAYFFREFVESMNQVKIQTAILIEQNQETKEKFKRFEKLESRVIILETRMSIKTQ